MEINDKIKEVSYRIAKQLEIDINIFGSSYLEIGELSIKRVDPTTITIKHLVKHKKKGCGAGLDGMHYCGEDIGGYVYLCDKCDVNVATGEGDKDEESLSDKIKELRDYYDHQCEEKGFATLILKPCDVRVAVKRLIKDEHINSDGECINRIRKIFGDALVLGGDE